MTDLITQLNEQIQVVARARLAATETAKARKNAYLEWELGHQSIIDAVTEALTEVGTAEAKLRELTLTVYKETGNKKPAEGVGIREVDRVSYEPAQAMDWALTHHLALKLDAAAFEKIVKAQPDIFKFVTIEKVATATIASEIPVKVTP